MTQDFDGNTKIIDGKEAAKKLREEIKAEVSTMGRKPGLAVILVGEDPASKVYVGGKIKACEEVGIKSFEYKVSADTPEDEVLSLINELNNNDDVNGILLQLPLPKGFDENRLVQSISPEKDVDGLTIANCGRLFAGVDCLVPCTPQGSMELIHSVQKDLTGLEAVVVGRSLLFGKPMGQLLLSENCTVTQAHSRTADLDKVCSRADILVVAVGRAGLVKKDWIKKGAIVIDVGINRVDNPDGGKSKLKGDVDYQEALGVAGAITPVPGGVGPMTIAFLLKNTLKAAKMQRG